MSSANPHFFQLFIATMSTSLQTSCNSIMIDWPDNHQKVTYKVKVAIINRNAFFSLSKGTDIYTHINMLLPNICRIYMSSHISFIWIYFDLSYSTQRWNAYVAKNLQLIKKREKRSMPITKTILTSRKHLTNEIFFLWRQHQLQTSMHVVFRNRAMALSWTA